MCDRPQATGRKKEGVKKRGRETFLLNIVFSSHWQLPHFSNTNGYSCWSACIRRLGVGPITASLSLSFITQFVCTLICGLALPAHPSNTHRHTWAEIYTCLPTNCQHLAFMGIETHAAYILLCTRPHKQPQQCTLMYIPNREISYGSFFSVTPNIIVCSSAIFQCLFQFSFDRYSVSHNLSQISMKTCTRRQ